MKKNSLSIFVLVITAIVFMAAGCMKVVKQEEVQKAAEPSPAVQPAEEKVAAEAKKEKVAEQPIKQEAVEADAKGEKGPAAKIETKDEVAELAEKQSRLLTIYFDFDRFTIMDNMNPVLDKNAQWLKKKAGVKIQVQGHADERGTNEYNIALGERRAQSVKKYLVDSGVNEAKLSTISYGEETPADPGHTEEAWAKNRRVEFVIVK
ncbi:MAG: peptidoglycan-associated lipoprotein Pal [Deltaproteobacteria bacterium]|nr:peptidoglycan-associated lipoprotein Pal [Deltaproteobacteria bacterium]